ncbi:MAG TPA: methylated-DNA--[protein]-cysteine S-methyltransferase, partial [Gaiellaceae bacterium]|nr:methylated-DNA--[protein]-cysteine S-methyltransferase [Gaiellaceae bacterium]
MTVPAELDRRFRDAAAAEGLLDAAYDLVDSPVGTLLVAATDRGLYRISYTPDVDALAAAIGPRVLRVPSRLAEVEQQLEEYVAGERRSFDLELDLRAPAFQQQVLRELALVPYGELATYGELARRIGRPAAVRAVGAANGANPIPIVIPC